MRDPRTLLAAQPRAGRGRAFLPLGGDGSVLVGVMAITTAVLLVGTAIFVLGHSEADIVEYAVDDARAFYVAEGGLERARGWLAELSEHDPNADPVGVRFQDQSLGGGSYTVTVVDDKTWVTGLPAYEIVSKGEHGGVVRGVKSWLVAESMARYQWFIESKGGAYAWFHSGERFEGAVHVNCDIGIDGDPWFGGRVSSAGGLTMKQGSDPTFTLGYQLHCDEIRLPDAATLENSVKTAALNGGLYVGAPPKGAYYRVELGRHGPGTMTYVGIEGDYNNPKPLGPPLTVDVSSLNGAVWFEGTVAISGTLDGAMTIVANGNVEVWDDILYYDATPYGGPNEGCDDILGLIAAGHPQGDVIIKYTPPNKNDCVVHGVMMALQKNIEAEDYQHHPPRGDFIIYGGVLADYSIHFAQLDEFGGVISGYRRDYRFDRRLFTMPPPHFPLSGRYVPIAWEEIRHPDA
jgi:hypothetical protein